MARGNRALSQLATDGPRDVGLVFIGASLVAGVGDPKGQGWVSRVVGRTQHPDLELTAYNLGVRGDTSEEIDTNSSGCVALISSRARRSCAGLA